MTKVSRVFQVMNISLLVLFFIEMVMLFSKIDLIPFIIMGIVCGLIIILNNTNEDFFYNDVVVKDTSLIFRFIFLALIDTLLFCSFLVLGIENMAVSIISLLCVSKLFRFVIYGFIFPLLISYFVSWFWTENKPNLSIWYALIMPNSMGIFYKVFFVFLMLGILICLYWEKYFVLISLITQFF